MPWPEMGLQVALAGHGLGLESGLHNRAHCEGVVEPDFSSAQVGAAEDPAGAAGHFSVGEQGGEQNEPFTPVICTASSPLEHGLRRVSRGQGQRSASGGTHPALGSS